MTITVTLDALRTDLTSTFKDQISRCEIRQRSFNGGSENSVLAHWRELELVTNDGGCVRVRPDFSGSVTGVRDENADEISEYLHSTHGIKLEDLAADFTFETKVDDDTNDFDEDFEDGFDFLDDEPEPQGPRP